MAPATSAATRPPSGGGGGAQPRAPMRPLQSHQPPTLPLMLIVSALAHVAGLWGILFHPVFQRPPAPRPPILVRLVELPAGVGGRTDVRPGGRAEAPRNVEAARPKEPPKTTLPGKVETPVKGAAPVKDPKPEGGAAGLGRGGQAGLGGKATGLLLDEPTFEYEWYKARLEDALKSRWRKPLLQAELRASVHFTISASGAASEVQIIASSGNAAFDQSVARAVYDAAPFPKFPPQYTSDRLGVLYTFELLPEGR